ncbi:histone chaperone ASF1A [Leishmania donovani]|uniref:Anti-silencing_protein_asf_1-like_protein n=3 Tax=Leishmania donovani species complex TaxID=38574 RepID=A0A6L0XB44_LEIIN|nr:anti-silencing protein asf 1-like protein [Leishmania infantum JPCM5]XP_003860347.1 anti-silencing protein asf 1-like protein [Leishmania donovani]CAC9484002.1 anti-silencing_protein_asf_1-like_protein [Leishmania infantum]TPP45566.1 ASF1 like histone chaperone family protein [Leishmania donovani]TPP49984.1 ASF1 like histone chaperone family protein [Leishmania donovani]CAJ1988297.1 histone chaperone ASF1A [Leishmania donovani]CAM67383.1 anti-silencing protein asf 1-like protein [Leishmani|eukprot:XP_001465139.1 anti-silencing protein asf 1-like protein [Leishmania infantum JPCM5]
MADPVLQLLEIELLGANPDAYTNQFQWRMRLEAAASLPQTLSVSFVWVGSASSSQHDQVLDDFEVGPLEKGITEFTLECDAPQMELVPVEDVVGVTILLISFQYRGQEFLRVGYYTQVAYFDAQLNRNPPPLPERALLGRFVAMPQPAVTVTPIDWGQ